MKSKGVRRHRKTESRRQTVGLHSSKSGLLIPEQELGDCSQAKPSPSPVLLRTASPAGNGSHPVCVFGCCDTSTPTGSSDNQDHLVPKPQNRLAHPYATKTGNVSISLVILVPLELATFPHMHSWLCTSFVCLSFNWFLSISFLSIRF